SHPEEAIQSAIQSIRTRPEFRHVTIDVISTGTREGMYDIKRLERVFHNLFLNACEAACAESGSIQVDVRELDTRVEVRVIDNGRGISQDHQARVFEPFFTHGKANGTGLGLTIAQKIVQDHGGDLRIEKTSVEGTTIQIATVILNNLLRDRQPQAGTVCFA